MPCAYTIRGLDNIHAHEADSVRLKVQFPLENEKKGVKTKTFKIIT